MSGYSPKVLMDKLDEVLTEKNVVNDYLDVIEKKTNVKKRYVVLAFASVLSLYLVIGYGNDLLCNLIGFVYPAYISLPGSNVDSKSGVAGFLGLWLASGFMAAFICNLVGFVYPAYKSVKAIESSNKDDDTEWLMYWVVFATFSVVEFFSDILLSWFPFYFLGKCLFLLWCMAPVSWNGSAMLYKKVIRPFILKNESKIDNVINKVGMGAKELVDQAHSNAKDMVADAAAEAVSTSIKKDE